MELAFESEFIRQICEDMAMAKLELGDTVAETLTHRLADLHAAGSICDLIVGNCRILDAGGMQRVYIDLPQGYRMVLTANHPRMSLVEHGDIDWASVTRIKILQIGRECNDKYPVLP